MAQDRTVSPSQPHPAVEIIRFLALVLLWTLALVVALVLPDLFLDPTTGVLDLG